LRRKEEDGIKMVPCKKNSCKNCVKLKEKEYPCWEFYVCENCDGLYPIHGKNRLTIFTYGKKNSRFKNVCMNCYNELEKNKKR
jgi:hypothetical protein